MKKYLLAFASLFLLAACEKESGETSFKTVGKIGEINISDVDDYYWPYYEITEIAFVARIHAHHNAYRPVPNPGEEDPRIMLRAPFDDRGTKLKLPEPPQKLLTEVTKDFPNAPNISDPAAKTVYYVSILCNISDDYSRNLVQYRNVKDASYTIEYIYSDRPVSITGLGADAWGNPTTFNLHLKKGWNMVVEKSDHNSHMRYLTHSMPAGIRWSRSCWI